MPDVLDINAELVIHEVDGKIESWEWSGPSDGLIGISRRLWDTIMAPGVTIPDLPVIGNPGSWGTLAPILTMWGPFTMQVIDASTEIIFCRFHSIKWDKKCLIYTAP